MKTKTIRPSNVTDEHLKYLDNLLKSGATNMFGVKPYLQQAFGLGRRDASDIISYWMQSFTKQNAGPPEPSVYSHDLAAVVEQSDAMLQTLIWIRKNPDVLQNAFFTQQIDDVIDRAEKELDVMKEHGL